MDTMTMFKMYRTPSQVAKKLTLCLKPSTNLCMRFPEETASTEVDRSELADSAPGPRRPTARGRGSGLVVARAHGGVGGGKGCWGRWGWRCCRTAAREGIWTSTCDASPHESLNKEAVLRLFIQQARAADANGVSKKLTVDR